MPKPLPSYLYIHMFIEFSSINPNPIIFHNCTHFLCPEFFLLVALHQDLRFPLFFNSFGFHCIEVEELIHLYDYVTRFNVSLVSMKYLLFLLLM